MIRPTTLLPWVLLALASCAPESEPKSASESIAEAEAAALRLYVFDCGRVRFDDEQLDAFDFGLTSEETDVRVLIASCYVVEHERGRLLWDGGLPLATAETEGWRDVDGKGRGKNNYQVFVVIHLLQGERSEPAGSGSPGGTASNGAICSSLRACPWRRRSLCVRVTNYDS